MGDPMSVSTRDGQAAEQPRVPDGESSPTAETTEAGEPSPPALSMPAVPGLVVLSSDNAPMCSDGVCL
jgi:hypothetical protein